jgi:serine/threonine protein phosphatase PrpC
MEAAAMVGVVPALALNCAARTDVGRRPNNEDALFGSGRLAAVADGVGGAAAGEVASRLVIDALAHLDKCRINASLEDEFRAAILRGNDALSFLISCRPQLAGMASTLTAVALANDGHYLLANIGDSRTYLLRAGRLEQLTRDASLVQALIDRGAITAAEAREHPHRSVVLEALDGSPGRQVALRSLLAAAGDRLLLCSDGLSDGVSEAAIAGALAEPLRERAAERLIELALAAGGRDNISVLVADVVARQDPGLGWMTELAGPSR